jgi:putative protein-disulfide isomerase
MNNPVLYYVHDPMCSWCWGFKQALEQLLKELPPEIETNFLVGGLAPDSDQPMPESMQQQLQNTWRHIQQRIPGVKFNYDFWTVCSPRRSTYPACRAVIAANRQNKESGPAMIEGIQIAYYQQARNPSDIETLADIAEQIGLDKKQFIADINSQAVEEELNHQIQLARAMRADSFPSLVLQINDSVWPVPVDYIDASNMLRKIDCVINAQSPNSWIQVN